jgi:hypothetical protein
LPHQAGAAFVSLADGSLAEPDKLDIPSLISSSRVDTLAPAVVCTAVGAIVAALASEEPKAKSTEAPKAPAGKITERVLRMRFRCVISFLPDIESGGFGYSQPSPLKNYAIPEMFASLAIVAGMTARAMRYGRKLKFGYRVHVIVRETEAEARLAAHRLLSRLDSAVGATL